MEHTLVLVVVICVFVAILVALIRYFGVPIPPIVVTIFWYLVIGIVCVALIRLMWPLLSGGSLNIGMLPTAIGIG